MMDKDTTNIEVAHDPVESLRTPSAEEIRYSAGYLNCDFSYWFSELATHWVAFFHSLGVEINLKQIVSGFDYPDDLSRVIPFEVDQEITILGMDAQTEELLTTAAVPNSDAITQDLLAEYYERRLLSILSRSWSGQGVLSCHYLPSTTTLEAEVVGTVRLDFTIGNETGTIWFGLGPRLLERFDLLWRESKRTRQTQSFKIDSLGDEVHAIRFELLELELTPDSLIDLMRRGSKIPLNINSLNSINLKIAKELWAKAELCQFRGRYAAKIAELNSTSNYNSSSATKVSVVLAEAILDRDAIAEHSQIGAYILSATPVTNTVILSVSNETVATANIVRESAGLFLNILPKRS